MTVPPAIEQRLTEQIPRLRRIRALRGAARSILVSLLLLYGIALLDIAAPLPNWARAMAFATWITTAGVLIGRWVVWPLRQAISLEDVVGEVEKRRPELGQRLYSVLHPDREKIASPLHGVLVEDTARRLKQLDFPQVISYTSAVAVAIAGLVALLSTAIVVASYPSAAHQLRRVALPWSRTYGLAAYYVHIVSPPTVLARGGTVTIAAYPKRYNTNERIHLSHAEATLIVRDLATHAERRYPMQPGPGGEFHARVPQVANDFDFSVELGRVRSEWLRVVVLDAVELTEATRIILSPPPYVGLAPQTRGFANITAFQQSLLELELTFDRPVAYASLEWLAQNANAAESVRLNMSSDRGSATACLRLGHSGRLRLVLATEERGQKLFCEKALQVQVIPDQPPQLEQLSGLARRLRLAKPEDIVAIDFTARDDHGLTAAVLEYQIGSAEASTQTVPIPLTPQEDARVATGRIEFPLAERVRQGDTVRLRLRVFDNRVIDELTLVPQDVVYPPTGWSELHIQSHAESLPIQEVLAQRDDLRDWLTSALAELTAANSEIVTVQKESAGLVGLDVHHQTRLQNAKARIEAARDTLRKAAAEAQLTPELRHLAANCCELVEPLENLCTGFLAQAETDQPDVRNTALVRAQAVLNPIVDQMRSLIEKNATRAQARVDRWRLLALAAELTAWPTLSPPTDRLAKHRQLFDRFRTLIVESPALQQAVAAAYHAEIQQWLRVLRQRLECLQQLDQQTQELFIQTRQELLGEMQRQLELLVKHSTSVFRDMETAGRLLGVTLPPPDDLLRIADLAAAGKTVEALAELEKNVQTLDRLAHACERWSAERADPKEAVAQLARWQDDLRARLRTATQKVGYVELREEEKGRFRFEQRAIVEALQALDSPPETTVRQARHQAIMHTEAALRSLADTGTTADAAMTAAAMALRQLAESMPSLAERLTLSLRAADALRLQWEATSNAIELTLKKLERSTPEVVVKQLAPFADKQRKLIPAVEMLDLPGLQPRHTRLVRAITLALADLQEGSPLDVVASQAWVRREFERLKWVLEGNPSPDGKAEQVAQKLHQLVQSLAVAPEGGADPPERLIAALQDIQRQLNAFTAPEAPALWQEARLSVQKAEQAIRDGPPERLRTTVQAAAEATRQLADRLNGRETDLERVQRLAYNRRLATEKSKERLLADDTLRQLSREAEELIHTRVGLAGTPLKKRAVDLYTKLRGKSDLDRFGTDHKALVAVLDELAAQMADRADLATLEPLPPPPPPPAAERIIPSTFLADKLRSLIRHHRQVHGQVTNLPMHLQARLTPGLWSSSCRRSLLQVLQIEQVIADLSQLVADQQARDSLDAPEAVSRQQPREALPMLREAEKRLRASVSCSVAGAFREAAEHRAQAIARLRLVSELPLSPAWPAVRNATGSSLLTALRAMQQPTEPSIRKAAEAMQQAAQSVGREN
ncbi:MAG: hypothetical protein RMJ56_13150 [Gemmataceae bacterium]|nr:hypothetical protein [Gemmata sp.]MDW8198543.1 hypothetical protein [Gemmataceae bacterium]